MSTVQSPLPWVEELKKYLNLRETPGKGTTKEISGWLQEVRKYPEAAPPWWQDDETPWCGLCVAIALGRTGRYVVKNWFRAKEWASTKLTRLAAPAYGCVVVFDRKGGGHVGFVVGKTPSNQLLVLGGNQSNAVNVRAFTTDRVVGYYWPSKVEHGGISPSTPSQDRFNLPTGAASLSTTEQ